MKKKGIKIHYRTKMLHFAIYDYTIHFVETDDFTLALQHAKLNAPPRDRSFTQGMTWNSNDRTSSYIFLSPKTPINVLVHECWHAVYRMLDSRGICVDDEVIAYTLDFTVKMATGFYGTYKA